MNNNVIAGIIMTSHGPVLSENRAVAHEAAVFVGFTGRDILTMLDVVNDAFPMEFEHATGEMVPSLAQELVLHTERDTMDDALVVFPNTNWIIIKGQGAHHVNNPFAVQPAWVMALGAK